jgi:hypothetical protein
MGRPALALALLVLAVRFSWSARSVTEDSGPPLESKLVDSPGVKANGCKFLRNGRSLYSATSSKEIMVWSLH